MVTTTFPDKVASANRVGVRYRQETTSGTAAVGKYRKMRFTSEGFRASKETTTSNEIADDRSPGESVVTKQGGGGPIAGEFSVHTWDDMIEAVLRSVSWTQDKFGAGLNVASTGIAFDNTGGVQILLGPSGNSNYWNTTVGYNADDVIQVRGSEDPEIDGTYLVVSITAATDPTPMTVLKLYGAAYTPKAQAASEEIRVMKVGELVNSTVTITPDGGNAKLAVISDSGSNGLFASAVVGDYVKVTRNSGSTANNVVGRITVVTDDNTVQVQRFDGSDFSLDAAASYLIDFGAVAINGTTERAFTIEKQNTDLASTFKRGLGQVPDTMEMRLQPNGQIELNFGFRGQTVASVASTAASGLMEAAGNNVNSGARNVTAVIQQGAEFSLRTFSLRINNNTRESDGLGSIGPVSVTDGEFSAGGEIEAYKTGTANGLIAEGHLDTELGFIIEDDNGLAAAVELPRVKFDDADDSTSGKNTDVTERIPFTAGKPTSKPVVTYATWI